MEELYLHKIIRRLGSKNFEPQIYGALFRNYQGRTEQIERNVYQLHYSRNSIPNSNECLGGQHPAALDALVPTGEKNK